MSICWDLTGKVLFIDLTTCFWRVPVVAATVGVKRGKQPVFLNDFLYALEAAHGSFFCNEKHRVVLTGGIIHRDNQILFLPQNPFMRAAILMNHYADQRRTLTFLTAPTTLFGAINQPCFL